MSWMSDLARPRLPFLLLLPLLVAVAIPAAADVAVTADAVDEVINGNCSLIEAVRSFNTGVAVDACASPTGAIVLPAGGDFVLTQPAETFFGDNGLPVIDVTLEIQGNGATIRRDLTAPRFRLLAVDDPGDVTLRDLVLRDGRTLNEFGTNGAGGAILNDGGAITLIGVTLRENGAIQSGGALSNSGTATLEDCTVTRNTSQVQGAALWSNDTLDVTRCEISENGFGTHAVEAARGSLRMVESAVVFNEAGIEVGSGATALIRNSTISFNRPEESSPTLAGAGVQTVGDTTLENVTVASNNGSSGDGVWASPSFGTLTLLNTVVADNLGFDCEGPVVSQGGNLVEEVGRCSGVVDGVNGDLTGVDPELGVLQDNGGPTRTQLPADTSPLVDAAVGPGCFATDQRGVSRPQGDDCDIGAVELEMAPEEPPPAEPEAIPTLDEVSLAFLWLLLAGVGVFFLRRLGG